MTCQTGAEGPPSQRTGSPAPFGGLLPSVLWRQGSLPLLWVPPSTQNAASQQRTSLPPTAFLTSSPHPLSGSGLCSPSNETPAGEGVETEPGSAASLPSSTFWLLDADEGPLCFLEPSPPLCHCRSLPPSPPLPSTCYTALQPALSTAPRQASALLSLKATFLTLIAQVTTPHPN